MLPRPPRSPLFPYTTLFRSLLRSPWGKAFTALRDNPIRAESLGISVQAYTLLSFAIGAVYAGVAGALFASLVQFIEIGRAQSELQSHHDLVCRLLLEKKKKE